MHHIDLEQPIALNIDRHCSGDGQVQKFLCKHASPLPKLRLSIIKVLITTLHLEEDDS